MVTAAAAASGGVSGGRGRCDEHLDHLMPHCVLSDTPSVAHGLAAATERALRAYGCDVIRDATTLLGMGLPVACRAQVLLQRACFYISLVDYDVHVLAAACLNTASKLDELPLSSYSILRSVHRVAQRRAGVRRLKEMEHTSRDHQDLAAAMQHTEKMVLRAVGFALAAEPVHCHLLLYAKLLGFAFHEAAIPQTAFDMLTDTYRTSLHCRFAGSVIACSCLFLSMRQHRHAPPSGEWWTLFDADTVDLVECTKAIADMYTWPAPEYKDLKCRKVPLPRALRV